MLGAIITLLLLAAVAYAVTQVGGVITLLFIAAVLFLAYKRLSLLTFTATFTVLLAAYTVLGEASAPAGVWKGFLWVLLALLWLLNVPPLRKALITRRFMKTYLKLLPADVADRARGARSRHGVVGRRAVHRQAELVEAAVREAAAALARRAGVPRRPLRRAVPDDRRLGHHPQARRPAAAGVGLPQVEGLLRDDHPEEVRRTRVLRLRALLRAREDCEPQRHGVLHGRRAELARARRAAEPLRHRGAEEPLPAAPRARRRSALLRADRPARGLGCRLAFPTPASCAAGQWQGREIVGLRLNFSKRYITLAPVATVVGLAFRMFDPDKLLGETRGSSASPAR